MILLNNKSILLISPETWDHIFVSKHHYAIHLAKKGNKIFFLNPPAKSEKVLQTQFNNVWSVHYKGFIKGLRYFPSFLQKFFIKKKFIHLQALCSTNFDIIWSFDNSVFFDFSALPDEILKISHIVDLNQDFETGKAAATATACFCTTDLIKKRLLKYNSNVWKINHGINTVGQEVPALPQLPGKAKVKAVLVGNLAMAYMDWFGLLEIAKQNLNVDFIFVGPYAKEFSLKKNLHHLYKSALYKLSNTYFPGKVASHEIPSILAGADILLLSYREEFHTDQANPHKMMEYLLSGKMIVTTYTSEYVELEEEQALLMAKTNNELPKLFQSATDNLGYWNNVDKQKIRQSYAFNNSYDKQINRIESIILSLNENTVS